jgi:hypothetical protein
VDISKDKVPLRKERREILNRMKEENDNRMKLIANLEVGTIQ